MDDKPRFLANLQPHHHEKLRNERADYVQREFSESYDVRAQRHFDILEAGGDPHDEDHRHAFVLHQETAKPEEEDDAAPQA